MTLLRAIVLNALLLSVSACVSRQIEVVPFLPPTQTATLDSLVDLVNQWQNVRSLVLPVDLQFETVEAAAAGQGRQYRTAQGRLLLQRPSQIRLNIEAPILSASIAEMASDGKHFQLLIHPAEYRALIVGTNDRDYRGEVAQLDEDPKLEKAGPLVNIRPQHFTGAFLIPPIPRDDPYVTALLHEERVIEPDSRPGAKPTSRVQKSYYVVTVGRLGRATPIVRYWFDRTGALTMGRQEVYDASGLQAADIRYSDYLPPDPATGVRLPSRVRIERPYDDYSLSVTVRSGGVVVNRDLPDTAFRIRVPEEWEGSIRRIDLDERANQSRPMTTLR
jgi:hypothetical protein